ncbi:MAG: TlpA family protein disulfide reductase [Actinomycetota bacterium]|nr:TlpA family protein disulfide reductase [Actinomycetota bacterium]
MRRQLAAAAACAAIALTGCSNGGGGNGIGDAANNAGGGSANGPVVQVPPAKRGKPLTISGTLLTGQPWSTSDVQGKVVVLNVWGSWCGPCQGEFAGLQKVWTGLQAAGKPVQLIGQDYKEDPATALATVKQRGLTYPSLRDDNGKTVLSLGSNFVAPPTTIVLDTRHRIAARVTGPVDVTTLNGLISDTLAGK